MATEIENVLAQFALLEPKEQQKFMALATAHLQGQPKKAKKAKKVSDDDDEKPKRELSGNQIKWNALVKTCREMILSSTGLEKLPQKVVMCVAGKLKEADNFEPSEEEVTLAYQTYIENPTLSKTQLKRAASSDADSVASAKVEKPKAAVEKPKAAVEKPKVEKPKAAVEKPKVEKPKAAVEKPKAAAPPTPPAKKAVEKPKVEKPKAAKPKVAPPPPPADDEEVIETEKWKHDGKDFARSKTAPFYCWDLKTQEYKGVWEPEKKAFDLSVADPYNVDDALSCE